MEKNIESNRITLLLDNFDIDSKLLWESFLRTDYNCRAIVTGEESFLPEGVTSVYDFSLEDLEGKDREDRRPKYFNEIAIPKEWRITASGKIIYQHEQKGKIYYADPKNKRFVKAIDWYDRKGIRRLSDYYNRYGEIFARAIYDVRGRLINKSWFSRTGQEIIVQNYITGSIILNEDGKVQIFRTKMDYILYFCAKKGLENDRVFFNSLSIPFFVSLNLSSSKKQDVLFWQEPIEEEIPGNMQIILGGAAKRTSHIVVQKRKSYDKLLALGADREKIHSLGFIYSFKKENHHLPKALICTNSDHIEHCHEIVEALPDMQFHICALTDMSRKLTILEKYNNVFLYPNIPTDILTYLFDICDYYFDINYESEIVSAVREAFLHNQLIFAYQETVHNREFVADEHIYSVDNFEEMFVSIKNIMKDNNLLDEHLRKQREAAMAENSESYVKLIEKL